MQLRDTLGRVFADPMFADLFPRRGQPAETPWRLALVTILQFAENLSDRQAAEAVRGHSQRNESHPDMTAVCCRHGF
jgi:transposase